MPNHYIKFKEPVYEGYENFSFNQLNYEVADSDLQFLESCELKISAEDFERVVDVFEKIVAADQIQSLNHLVTRFKEKAPQEYALRISQATLEVIYKEVSVLWFCFSFP